MQSRHPIPKFAFSNSRLLLPVFLLRDRPGLSNPVSGLSKSPVAEDWFLSGLHLVLNPASTVNLETFIESQKRAVTHFVDKYQDAEDWKMVKKVVTPGSETVYAIDRADGGSSFEGVFHDWSFVVSWNLAVGLAMKIFQLSNWGTDTIRAVQQLQEQFKPWLKDAVNAFHHSRQHTEIRSKLNVPALLGNSEAVFMFLKNWVDYISVPQMNLAAHPTFPDNDPNRALFISIQEELRVWISWASPKTGPEGNYLHVLTMNLATGLLDLLCILWFDRWLKFVAVFVQRLLRSDERDSKFREDCSGYGLDGISIDLALTMVTIVYKRIRFSIEEAAISSAWYKRVKGPSRSPEQTHLLGQFQQIFTEFDPCDGDEAKRETPAGKDEYWGSLLVPRYMLESHARFTAEFGPVLHDLLPGLANVFDSWRPRSELQKEIVERIEDFLSVVYNQENRLVQQQRIEAPLPENDRLDDEMLIETLFGKNPLIPVSYAE